MDFIVSQHKDIKVTDFQQKTKEEWTGQQIHSLWTILSTKQLVTLKIIT